MSAHTPGPWEVCGTPLNDYWHEGLTIGAKNERDGRRVCDVTNWSNDKPPSGMTASNARLIAAAPEMLEALQAFVSQHEASDEVLAAYDQAKAAIAKATQP